ncbi:chromosomal replication initiator protein DnaA [bacterium]|nr:chromosomal replication initiator protein DnaA [bacterium]
MEKADFTYILDKAEDTDTKKSLNPDDVWKIAKEHLKLMIGSKTFGAIFRKVYIENIQNGVAQLSCDSDFKKQKILKDHLPSLKMALKKASNMNLEVELNVAKEEPKKDSGYEYVDTGDNGQINIMSQIDMDNKKKEQMFQESNLNPKYLFSNFVVGANNKLAEAVAEGIVKDLGHYYNPFVIYGNSGMGKTHLMQAIGNEVLREDPTKRVLYISIEQFLNEMVEAIRTKTNQDFRNKYRRVDLLIIDDIQFVEDYPHTQEEFFHTFDELYQANKQIVLASDRSPQEIKKLSDRLRTRLLGGMTADIKTPDYETRVAILRQLIEENNATVDDKYVDFIAKNIQSSVRELEGAMKKVISLCQLGMPPTEETLAQMLQIDIDYKRKKIPSGKVISAVSEVFDVKPADIKGKGREAYVAECRQIVMYLLRTELEFPLEKVAKEVNRKDHTTVIHACKKIDEKREKDSRFNEKIEKCLTILRE